MENLKSWKMCLFQLRRHNQCPHRVISLTSSDDLPQQIKKKHLTQSFVALSPHAPNYQYPHFKKNILWVCMYSIYKVRTVMFNHQKQRVVAWASSSSSISVSSFHSIPIFFWFFFFFSLLILLASLLICLYEVKFLFLLCLKFVSSCASHFVACFSDSLSLHHHGIQSSYLHVCRDSICSRLMHWVCWWHCLLFIQ